MSSIKKNAPGIAICIVVAFVSAFLAKLSIGSFSLEVIGAPVFAILFGMVITLIMPSLASKNESGIKFTSKKVLQWAVVLLGFSLNINKIAEVGSKSLPVIISTVATSLIAAFIMMKLLKIDSKVATLIGVGSSICGGSAIAATAPVINADDKEIAQSISVIFLFNVLAALIFPTLGYRILGLGSEGFAVFAGTAVNDTSSVTAAASTADGLYGLNEVILPAATTVKLTRTLAIIPITLVLSFITARKSKKEANFSIKKIFPFFILYFVAASIVTTVVGNLQEGGFKSFYMNDFVHYMKVLSKFFIAMAMCAIGLNTNIVQLVRKGGKPILMGFVCWVSITAVSLLVQYATGIYFTNY